MIPACGAVALRWKCDEMEQWLTQNVISRMSFSDVSEITPEESREVIDALVDNVPLVGNYVNELQFAGMSAAAITSTVAGQIRSLSIRLCGNRALEPCRDFDCWDYYI